MTLISLPIDSLLPELCEQLHQNPTLVLRAAPGAGKTTRVPPAILRAGLLGDRQLMVLQPRRVAARSTALRMAEEWSAPIGGVIGYQVRFDRKLSAATKILVVTEGVLIRRLLDDPFLENVGGVILDEFHERHLETDLAIAMLRRVQQTVRPDLKLVVMSATLGLDALKEFLPEAAIQECPVRTFPVEMTYRELRTDFDLSREVLQSLLAVCDQQAGDVLVFLPGVGEILRTRRLLEAEAAANDWSILPLYGDLSPAEQDRVFQPDRRRKVILSTNVAETSLTIPGVTIVIDSGLARQMEFDSSTGLNRLVLQPISQASAEQRAGRAGRTAPGLCIRLWSPASQRARPAQQTAEIHRIDLSAAVLQLKSWGESDLSKFPWFDAPSPTALDHAERDLRAIGAIDDHGVTDLGQRITAYPLAPRLARLILAGAAEGCLRTATVAAALLSERDPFVGDGQRGVTSSRPSSSSDLLDCVEELEQAWRGHRQQMGSDRLNRELARRIEQIVGQLQQVSQGLALKGTFAENPTQRGEALGKAVLAAFPDRLVKRRQPGSPRGIMVGGRGTRLGPLTTVRDPELMVALKLDDRGEEAVIQMASAVEEPWLTGPFLRTETALTYDSAADRVQARKQRRWFDLVLEESPVPLGNSQEAARVLADAACENWDRVFPPADSDVANWLSRVEFLRQYLPESEWPVFSEAALHAQVETLAYGCRSLEDLRQADWFPFLQQQLSAEQQTLLEREAPSRIQVPSGSRIAIQYAAGQAPVLAVRIQEVFGWHDAPRLARGRVPLLLHLLSPNHRPQQITDDLKSFWTTAYQQVRGELRRRYPKHAWPEDPWTALAERKPQRKR